MRHITTNSIREHLKELKQVKSRHPEVLNEIKSYWKNQLQIKLNN